MRRRVKGNTDTKRKYPCALCTNGWILTSKKGQVVSRKRCSNCNGRGWHY